MAEETVKLDDNVKIVRDRRKTDKKPKRKYTVDPAKNHLRAKGGFGDNPQNRNHSGKGGFKDNPQNRFRKDYWWQSYRTVTKRLYELDAHAFRMLGYYWGILEDEPFLNELSKEVAIERVEELLKHEEAPRIPNAWCIQGWTEINNAMRKPKDGHWLIENIEGKAVQRVEQKNTDVVAAEEAKEWEKKYLEMEERFNRMMVAKVVNEDNLLDGG